MKSYYPFLLVILVMLFVAVSCKFDDEHYTTQQSQRKTSLHQLPEKIVFAFDRFHEHISRIKDKIDPNTLGAMDYGNAIVKQNEDGSTSYTIPLFRVSEELEDSRFTEDSIALTSDQTSTSYQFDNLVIKQMKNGRLWGHLIRYNPTPSWYTSQPTNTKDFTTFSGVMTIFNVHAKQIASIVMENGNEINTIETPPENNDDEQPNATPTFTISSPHIRRVDNCEVVCTHTTRTVSYKWTKSKRGTNESIRLGEVVVTISCRKVYTREYYFADDEDNDHLDYDDECDNFEDIFDDYYDDFEDDKDDWYDYYNKNRINTTPRVPTCKTNEEKNAYGKCVPKCLAGYTRNAYGNCVRICPEGQIKGKNGKCIQRCPKGKKRNKYGECVTPCDPDEDGLEEVFPNTDYDILEDIADDIRKYGKDFGIDTKEKLQHFLAQAGHESTNYAGEAFGAFEENLNYRWRKLGQIDYWDYYFNTIDDPTADPNKQNPNDYKRSESSDYVDVEKFANLVYNDINRRPRNRIGNTQTGDGYKYRGRGIFQLTGKYNYQEFTTFYQKNYDNTKDFVLNPELIASNKELSVLSALWFYKKKVLDKITVDDDTSVEKVTELINGGDNGIEHREELTEKAKKEIDCD